MATKSLTITQEAYERLAAWKEPRESFSEVITRITQRYSLLDLAGTLSSSEAKILEEHNSTIREDVKKRLEKTASLIR